MTEENKMNDDATPVSAALTSESTTGSESAVGSASANDFSGFGLPAKLLHALVRMQFKSPTPIQSAAIPLALEGRDILGSAQTGTGKTGAFGIPIIAKLIDNPQSAALIMTPTRELASQVIAALHQMIPVQTIRTALLIGGEPMPKQFRQLQAQPRLIVGTPGRIYDHLSRGGLRLNNVRFLVLDETDRMLDMGFGIQIEKIVAHVPTERQTMMFSATLPPGIVKLSSKYLNKPERISVGSTIAAPTNIKQELLQVTETEKFPKLLEQLKDNAGSVIIFVKTKYGTEKLAEKLTRQNFKADAINGDLRQSRRDRVIQNFRDRKFQILVATDLAARGLDVPHIDLVINFDLPQCPEDYLHRIGRTARAGATGKAVNLLTPADRAKWRAIHMLMNPSSSGSGAPGVPRPARNENYASKGRRDRPSFFGDKKRGRDERGHGFGASPTGDASRGRDGGGYKGNRDHARPERSEGPARHSAPYNRDAGGPERSERSEGPARHAAPHAHASAEDKARDNEQRHSTFKGPSTGHRAAAHGDARKDHGRSDSSRRPGEGHSFADKRDGRSFAKGPRDATKRVSGEPGSSTHASEGPRSHTAHRDGAKRKPGGSGFGGHRDGASRGGGKSGHSSRAPGQGQHRGRAAS